MSDEFNMPPADSTEQPDAWNLPPAEGEQAAAESFFANDEQPATETPAADFGAGDFGAGDNFGAMEAPADNFGAMEAPASDQFGTMEAPAGDNFGGAMEAPAGDNFGAMEAPADNFGAMEVPADNFGAMEAPAVVDKGAAYTAEWEARLKQQEAEEVAAKQVLKESAEKFLDGFHDKKTDEKLAKMEKNRKDQDETAAENERLLEIARSDDLSRWKRVYELVNTDITESENSRMGRLLLNLKIKGITTAK